MPERSAREKPAAPPAEFSVATPAPGGWPVEAGGAAFLPATVTPDTTSVESGGVEALIPGPMPTPPPKRASKVFVVIPVVSSLEKEARGGGKYALNNSESWENKGAAKTSSSSAMVRIRKGPRGRPRR